ncbi:hypothetical protein AAFF_G00250410 [Aldrovandia affinis]|uniref:Ig-like domain-containing protein n=1 Tax=Aldrovandia affinis TaxID=143900 RepID=A0AAD7RD49_9TELE|nr:hypothetical protein AAFF_G00250410 [Aldrovandia affinis]
MRGNHFALALLMCCGSGPNELYASSELQMVRPGDNVTLPCNLTLNQQISWYRQLSDAMIPLTTTVRNNLENKTITSYHVAESDHFIPKEDGRTKSVSLRVIGVGDSDHGLYYCVEWDGGRFFSEKQLGWHSQYFTSDGFTYTHFCKDSGPERLHLSCWTLLAMVPAAFAMATAVCICGLWHRKEALGRSICSNCVSDNDSKKEVNLNYASLHLTRKPRPPQQRETPHLSGDIIYAAVSQQTLTNQNS